jgi:hypothetical protein
MGIVAELVKTERPELLRRSKEDISFLAFCSDPKLLAWSEVANQKALRILKERRKQDGRGESDSRLKPTSEKTVLLKFNPIQLISIVQRMEN